MLSKTYRVIGFEVISKVGKGYLLTQRKKPYGLPNHFLLTPVQLLCLTILPWNMTLNHNETLAASTGLSRVSIRELDDEESPKYDRPVFIPALNHTTTYASEKTAIENVSDANTTYSQDEQSRHRSPRTAHLIRIWKWELATWLLGTIGFAANIILLICFDGKRQSQWKSHVQITTFVAALAQLSQSALLVPVSFCISQLKWTWFVKEHSAADVDRFDLASRGPDGSMRLLYRLGWRP